MLGRDFQQHGEEVIARVRVSDPATYLKVVASLLPRQLQLSKHSPLSDLSDSELDELQRMVAAMRAKTVQALEQLETSAAAPIEPAAIERQPIVDEQPAVGDQIAADPDQT